MRSPERIKRKYGSNCFKNWGKRGGSPILLAYKRGKIPKRLIK